MRSNEKKPLLSLLAIAVLALAATPARAEIVGALEAPSRWASQISNVQGWAYTTTPGAELIQPFDVRIDGTHVQQVPCCSDRADVKGNDPDIPLRTGFSGVINWAREALASDGPVVLSVIIRDTAGGELVLEETLDLYAMASFPFSRTLTFPEVAVGAADAPGATQVNARCTLSNEAGPDGVVAELTCSHLAALKSDGTETEVCRGQVRFTWDRATQGFKQSSSCQAPPRWTDNGDGTATDNTTGLVWELKTGEPGVEVQCFDRGSAVSCGDPHEVNNRYSWSPASPYGPTGSAFTLFLDLLNGGYSANGTRTTGCFAGHCDWRLPTIEELRHIADDCSEDGCGSIPGATAPWYHWSRTENLVGKAAWDVDFETGVVADSEKDYFDAVRAVRGVGVRPTFGDERLVEVEVIAAE